MAASINTKNLLMTLLLMGGFAHAESVESRFREADAALNRVYLDLRSKLNDLEKEDLKNSQNNWIKVRDRDAKRETEHQKQQEALLRNTLYRTKELEDTLNWLTHLGSQAQSETSSLSQIRLFEHGKGVYQVRLADEAEFERADIKDYSQQDIVFANEQFIVVKDEDWLGFGMAKTNLHFFGATTLRQIATVTLPNHLANVDYNASRNQFLVLTTNCDKQGERLSKYAQDGGQVVLLFDFRLKSLERVHVWGRGYSGHGIRGLFAEWRENSIAFGVSDFDPMDDDLPPFGDLVLKTPAFRDITFIRMDLGAVAEHGNMVTQYNLGVSYLEGEGVAKNAAEAVKWFRRAARQGYTEAQFALGLMYFKGEGVPKDVVEAYAWWTIAASNGHGGASTNRGIANQSMTPSQRQKGQQRAQFLAKDFTR